MWYNKGSLLLETPFLCFYVKEEMNEEKIREHVEEALDADTFDVMSYIENQDVASDEVTVYVNIKGAKKLKKLVEKRREYLAEKRALEASGKGEPVGLDEAYEDTEYDDEINALVDELEKTALVFELKSVAPALVRAIDKHYAATEDKGWSDERKAEHNADRVADLLSRAIAGVRRGDGKRDPQEWDKERLKKFEEQVYDEEFGKLLSGLYEIVYAGSVFEEALNADFS